MRRAAELYQAVFIALWLSRAVFDYAFDIDGTTLLVLTIVLALTALAIGIQQAKDVPNSYEDDRPDLQLEWTAAGGAAAASFVALYGIDMPWGGLLALAIAAGTILPIKRS